MNNLKTKFFILGIFVVVATVLYIILNNEFEPRVQDFAIKSSQRQNARDEIMLVIIDQKSINRIRFPWRRSSYAKIFEYLHDYGNAKVIAFDSFIFNPDSEALHNDEYTYKNDKKLQNKYKNLIPSDIELIERVKNYDNFISGFTGTNINDNTVKMTAEEVKKFNQEKIGIKITEKPPFKIAQTFLYVAKLLPEYMESVNSFGTLISPQESDGTIRASYPLIKLGNDIYPMLAFSAYAKYKGINHFYIDKDFIYSADNKTLKVPVLNARYGSKMYLKWYNNLPNNYYATHNSRSAIDVIDSLEAIKKGEKPVLNAKDFDGKIVLIGAYANVKSLEDIKSTPIIKRSHSGLDIQATTLGNLLDNEAIRMVGEYHKILISVILILITAWGIINFSFNVSILLICLLLFSYNCLAFTLLQTKGIMFPFIVPTVMILLVVTFGFSYRFLVEGRKKEQIQNAMGLYISRDIMKNVVKNIDNISLGGKKANISVLFADIRGFTSLSEKMSAEEVCKILNDYFSMMEPVIRKYNGVLNKFMGDAVLAIFGEPIQDKNHAVNAVRCANEIHQKMTNLQEKWITEGHDKIEIGIAINTGDAFVGNIGSSERLEYTVIGDTVNTASRIESFNKVYKTKFLISESTYDKVNRFCDVIKIREVSIRGKIHKINIYEVIRVFNDIEKR